MKCNTHSPRGKQTGGLNELLEPTQCSQLKLPACQNSQRSPWGAISHAAHCQNRRVFSSHFPHPGRAAYSRISAVSTSSCISENWKDNIISLHQTSYHNKARPVVHTSRECLHYSLTHLRWALHHTAANSEVYTGQPTPVPLSRARRLQSPMPSQREQRTWCLSPGRSSSPSLCPLHICPAHSQQLVWLSGGPRYRDTAEWEKSPRADVEVCFETFNQPYQNILKCKKKPHFLQISESWNHAHIYGFLKAS